MPTSQSTSWNPTLYQLINRSLRIVGAYASTDNPRPEQQQDALYALNGLIKSLQVEGFLWLKTFCTLFLNKGQVSYNLTDAAGFSHCATSYIETTTTADVAAGAGTVDLTSVTGMTDGDYIGICTDSGVIEWFTATFAGNTATLSDVTTLIASSGNVVYTHSAASQIRRPTRVFTAVRRLASNTVSEQIEVPITLYSRDEYVSMPNKTVQGKPVQAFYDPQLVTGMLYIWPTADTPNDKIVLTVDRPVQDMLADTDTFDFPQEWIDLLATGLAMKIAPEYGVALAERQILMQEYAAMKDAVGSYNRENAPTFIQRGYM